MEQLQKCRSWENQNSLQFFFSWKTNPGEYGLIIHGWPKPVSLSFKIQFEQPELSIWATFHASLAFMKGNVPNETHLDIVGGYFPSLLSGSGEMQIIIDNFREVISIKQKYKNNKKCPKEYKPLPEDLERDIGPKYPPKTLWHVYR